MRIGSICSTEFTTGDRRLNGSYYLSEDELAMRSLRQWKGDRHRLADIVRPDGLFSGGIFRMVEARDGDHGLPYVSAKDLVMSEIISPSYISRRHGALLNRLTLREDMIVITCSGMNLGKSIWVRGEMDGLCASGDLIRIVVDESKCAPGYVHAYLSSRYGWVSLRQLIFGGNIKHIEPKSVGQIFIPRIGQTRERKADDLVKSAAKNRTDASKLLSHCRELLVRSLGPAQRTEVATPQTSTVSSNDLESSRRLEGFYYNPTALRIDEWVAKHPNSYARLSEIADIYDVPPFKHIYVGKGQGVPFYTSGDLFSLDRKPRYYLSRTQTRGLDKYIIPSRSILLARSGQLGGIIGRPQYADAELIGAATSDHVIRIVPRNAEKYPPGFLFTYLSLLELGYPLITRTMSGKSVPALWPCYLHGVRVLKAPIGLMRQIHEEVESAFQMRLNATAQEDQARAIIDNAIGMGM